MSKKFNFTGTVTRKSRGFLHIIRDEAGKEIGRRLSNKTYRFAAVGQKDIARQIAHCEREIKSCDSTIPALETQAAAGAAYAEQDLKRIRSYKEDRQADLEFYKSSNQDSLTCFVVGYSNTGKFDDRFCRVVKVVTFEPQLPNKNLSFDKVNDASITGSDKI